MIGPDCVLALALALVAQPSTSYAGSDPDEVARPQLLIFHAVW